MANEEKKLVEIENLRKYFPIKGTNGPGVQAVQDVSLYIKKGETLGLVGESGCGKTTLGRTILRLYEPTGGKIIYDGQTIFDNPLDKDGKPLGKAKSVNMLPYRKKMQIIFQDPSASLDPRMTVGEIIGEAIDIHKLAANKKDRADMIKGLLARVGLNTEHANRYPHEFSGGMRQRVVIAIAAACRPQVLICDEPTTALDVTIQAQLLPLIRDLQKELGMSVIYITHDLGVVANVADRVAVMYAGQIVEYGTVEEIFYDAWHPYTWALLQALPQLGTKGEALPTIDGTPPNLFNEIKGDAFAPRNKHALAIDFVAEPPFFQVSETHAAKTWYLDPRAPKIERPHSIQNLREKMGKMGGSNLNG